MLSCRSHGAFPSLRRMVRDSDLYCMKGCMSLPTQTFISWKIIRLQKSFWIGGVIGIFAAISFGESLSGPIVLSISITGLANCVRANSGEYTVIVPDKAPCAIHGKTRAVHVRYSVAQSWGSGGPNHRSIIVIQFSECANVIRTYCLLTPYIAVQAKDGAKNDGCHSQSYNSVWVCLPNCVWRSTGSNHYPNQLHFRQE